MKKIIKSATWQKKYFSDGIERCVNLITQSFEFSKIQQTFSNFKAKKLRKRSWGGAKQIESFRPKFPTLESVF